MNTSPTPKHCGLATASLVLGIIGLLLDVIMLGALLTIPAVILGYVAKHFSISIIPLVAISAVILGYAAVGEINRSNGAISGSDLAKTGLILGYVNTSISIAILLHAWLLGPAINSTLLTSKMTGTLCNGKQIFRAMIAQNLNYSSSNNVSSWPQSSNYATSTAVFTNLVGNGVISIDYALFSASGLMFCKETNAALFEAGANAWCIVADINDSDSDQAPLLFTRNLKISSLAEFKGSEQLTDDPPFGRQGVVVIFKGGAATIMKPEMLASNFNSCHATNRVLRP